MDVIKKLPTPVSNGLSFYTQRRCIVYIIPHLRNNPMPTQQINAKRPKPLSLDLFPSA